MDQAVCAIPRTRIDLDDVLLEWLRTLVVRQRAAPGLHERITLSLETVAAFLDCLERGLKAEARALLEHLPDEGAPTAA